MNKIKCVVLSFVFTFLSVFFAFSSSASLASKKTALRYLTLADEYYLQKNYKSCVSQITLGLNYDDTISDLWYMWAVVDMAMDKNINHALESVKKSLELNNWNEYKIENARLLYADLLCTTLNCRESLSVLDSAPLIYSSDAEYIRAKNYYIINSETSKIKARERVETARKIFPNDFRFLKLFFMFEDPDDENESVKSLAEKLLKQIKLSKREDFDFECLIYSIGFSSGDEKIRLLKAFNAAGFEHPLYAIYCMEENLMTEEKAFYYLKKYFDSSINVKYINQFISLISDENVINLCNKYFTSFEGELLQDSEGDGITNLFVKYSRGRPETVFYDKNQDGVIDWTLICDFGTPRTCTFNEEKKQVFWNDYPYVEKYCVPGNYEDSKFDITYSFINDGYKFNFINVRPDSILSSKLNMEFYFPDIKDFTLPDNFSKDFLTSVNFIDVNKTNDSNTLHYILEDNAPITLQYFIKDKLKSVLVFDAALPIVKLIDIDSSGVFETTDFYSFIDDSTSNKKYLEFETYILKTYMNFSYEKDFTLARIQVDRNENTVLDYAEEYFANDSKVISWDNDEDGKWDIKYYTYKDEEGKVFEKNLFYLKINNSVVEVTLKDSVPVSVSCGVENLQITKDEKEDFYWVGDFDSSLDSDYYSELARKIIMKYLKNDTVSIYEAENFYVSYYRVDNKNYGLITPKIDLVNKDENSGE